MIIIKKLVEFLKTIRKKKLLINTENLKKNSRILSIKLKKLD